MNNTNIAVDIILRSASGLSILEKAPDERDLSQYAANEETRQIVENTLRQLGFTIKAVSPYGLSITGPRELVRNVFGEDELTVPESLIPWVTAVRILPEGEWYR